MPPSRRVPASAPSLLPRARSLVAATALLCVVVLSDAVLPARADPMPREVLESLPDWEEDIGLRRALKCNACAIAVNELVENLNAKRAKMRRKLTTDEAITALERGCITARKDWGLQMRNNKVTPVYSNDHTVARAEGSWISTFVVNACGEVVGEHDETVLHAWKSNTPLLELQGRVCKTGKHGATGPGEGDGSNSKIDDSYPNGLGVCPATADMSLVNTHDDGWSSWDGPQHKKGGANTPVQKNPPEMKVEL